MTLTAGELAIALSLAFGLLGMSLAALVSRGDRGAMLGGGGIGAFMGFMLALRMASEDDGMAKAVPTVTKTAPPAVVDLRGIAEIISAANNLPIVVIGFAVTVIALAGIFAWAVVRVTDNNRRSYSEISNNSNRREINRGNLPVVQQGNPAKRNPFENWN
jgi:hypothetical protein